MLNYLKIPFWTILLSFIYASVEAQVHSSQQFTHRSEVPDSTADLHHFFQRGHFHGHARSYWMGTDNEKAMPMPGELGLALVIRRHVLPNTLSWG